MDVVKRLELDLHSATEKQLKLQEDLHSLINENESFRKLNSDLQRNVSGGSNLQSKELNDKIAYEKKRREKLEKELELFKSEFDNQLTQQLDLAVADARNELHLQIEKTKQIAEEQSKVYDELESYKLQLTAAEKKKSSLKTRKLKGKPT